MGQRVHSIKGKTILWILIILLLLGGVYYYTHRNSTAGRKYNSRQGVTVETMERKDMMKRVVLSGETVPKASVNISPKYGGRIAAIYVDLGDHVEAGDVLLSQDTKDVSLSLAAVTRLRRMPWRAGPPTMPAP